MSSNVTLKHIADALGVSTMTVSRAINNRSNVDKKTKARVLKQAQEMGYTPNHIAKSLVSKKTFTIGVVVPEIAHSFFANAIQGIEEVTFEQQYQLILTHSAEQADREQYALHTLQGKRVDGILISSAEHVHDYEFYTNIIKSEISLVFFDRCVADLGASCISVDDEAGAFNVTQHLIDHGYHRIAHLSGPQNISIGKDRLQGYKKALKKNGISVDNSLVEEAGFHEKAGYDAMSSLIQKHKQNPVRAVFAVNDPAAFGAMDAIYDHGLSVPEEIALVGFSDDIRASLMRSPLTTVRQPARELGKRAAQKLISHIEHADQPVEHIELQTTLKIRSSCGCS